MMNRRELLWTGGFAVAGLTPPAFAPFAAQTTGEFDDLIAEMVRNGKRIVAHGKNGGLPKAEHARAFASHVRLFAARAKKLDADGQITQGLEAAIAQRGRAQLVNDMLTLDVEASLKATTKRAGWDVDDLHLNLNNRIQVYDVNGVLDAVLAGRSLIEPLNALADMMDGKADELGRLGTSNLQLVREDCSGYQRMATYLNYAFDLLAVVAYFGVAVAPEILVLVGGVYLTYQLMYFVCDGMTYPG